MPVTLGLGCKKYNQILFIFRAKLLVFRHLSTFFVDVKIKMPIVKMNFITPDILSGLNPTVGDLVMQEDEKKMTNNYIKSMPIFMKSQT
jgi:hypothetical protein